MEKILKIVVGLVIISFFTACEPSPEQKAERLRCQELSRERTEYFAISNICYFQQMIYKNGVPVTRSHVFVENGESFWEDGIVLADSCKKIPRYYPRKVIDGDSVRYIHEFIGYRYETIH